MESKQLANEDMDGIFFGGGAIEHVVKEGEIYLCANQIALLIGQTGIKMAISAIQMNDPGSAEAAHLMMVIAEKVHELRSELLKRELDAALPDLSLIDPQKFFDI